MTTRAQIIKAIGNPNLKLHKGPGYFYFEYDDETPEAALYATRSIYVNTLNELLLPTWVQLGEDFAKEMEQ